MGKAKDITLRVLAVLISIILWVYITNVENPEREVEISNVPVKIVNIDSLSQANLTPVSKINDITVNVTIKGRSRDVLAVKPQDIKAEADMSSGTKTKGENSIPVTIKDKPIDIEVENQPLYITVELDDVVTKNTSVNIETKGQVKSGYVKLAATANPQQVTLSGASMFINKITSVVARADIKDASSTLSLSSTLQFLDKDGKLVTGNEYSKITCNPQAVELTIPVKRAKDVPINIKQTGKLPQGVLLKGITSSVTKITITGDDSVINDIDSIDTQPVSLDSITSSITKTVKLSIPSGVMIVDNIKTINVSIDVESIVSKSFDDVQVKYINLPPGLTASETPVKTVKVTLSGRQSALSSVSDTDISASVDLSGAPADGGQGDYTVTVNAPDGLTVTSVSPEKVKVNITKG
ncbi:MAG TPA: hypothetical protein DD426_05305 [Clostridiaceae bacterium]|nr:hypothetical protein [Clostridiaceae bacterium]